MKHIIIALTLMLSSLYPQIAPASETHDPCRQAAISLFAHVTGSTPKSIGRPVRSFDAWADAEKLVYVLHGSLLSTYEAEYFYSGEDSCFLHSFRFVGDL